MEVRKNGGMFEEEEQKSETGFGEPRLVRTAFVCRQFPLSLIASYNLLFPAGKESRETSY